MLKRGFFLLFCIMVMCMTEVRAQTFGNNDEFSLKQGDKNNSKLVSDQEIANELSEEETALRQKWLENNVFIPRGGLDVLNKQTEDGSK